MTRPATGRRQPLGRRLAWLVLLWCTGVAAVALVAALLKILMRGVGLLG